MICDEFLYLTRKMMLNTFHIPRAVQQECSAVNQFLNHIVLAHIGRVMTSNKVCFVDQISRFDRLFTETQVRHGHTAGLLGIIVKVSLSVHVCVITDDLDGVLVSSYRTVCAQTPEFAVDGAFRSGYQRLAQFQRQIGHIIHDTDGEFRLLGVIVNSNDLSRCGIFGTQTITAGEYRSTFELGALQCRYNIQIQRLAHGARLFRSVKYRDLFYGLRDRCYQCLRGERSVKTNFYDADFFTGCHQVVDGLFDGITYRTHSDDHAVRVCCAVVVKQLVICTDLSVNLVHVFLNNSRHIIVIYITCFSCLEEDIRVLSRTSLAGMIRIQALISPSLDRIEISDLSQILVIPLLDLLDLMRSTETVKEINERKTTLDCCKMSDRRQVHNLLNAGFAQHTGTGLSTGINIGVISENRKCMAGQGTRGYIEHARKSFTCNLVEVRDHKQ